MPDILTVYKKIKSLEIQGATNVAVSALKVIADTVKKSKNPEKDLDKYTEMFANVRPTEPLLRNGLKFLKIKLRGVDIKKEITGVVKEYLEFIDEANKQIVEVGSKRIQDGFSIMTHCHSSTVVKILKEAHAQGKKITVYACETRPLFQGRITAKELAKEGIEVYSIVDSAKRFYINDMDLAIVGADALTADSRIINKIGTSMLAMVAKEARTPFMVAATLLKYDPTTGLGENEPIEMRDEKEVWDRKPKGVKVLNPAFDITLPEYVDYMVTEVGIINPFTIELMALRKYPWLMR